MRILVAEDDHETSEHIALLLRARGHDVVAVASGEQAIQSLLTGAFDAAVLDRMLPGQDGMAVLASARDAKLSTPILILTALGSIGDRVEGLEAGADDYLVKPFAASELIARLNALERRSAGERAATTLSIGALQIDLLRREARVNGTPLLLQPRELRLLEELARQADQVVTRSMLLEAVWGYHFDPQTNIVESHLSRLRTKLGQAGARNLIETVRGAGYRLKGGR